MKKLFFILTLLLFFTSSALCNDDCSNLQTYPNIKVISSYGKLIYDHNKSKEELTYLAEQQNYLEKGLFANGLSTANLNFDITLKTKTISLSDGVYCAVPDEIILFLGFDEPIIYISKELKENSCEYNIVLRHEKTHQQINKKTLEYYLPLFKSASTSIIKNIKPSFIKNTEDLNNITNYYIQRYNQKLNPLVDFIKNEILKQQQKLDNIDNYKYENSLCN